MKFSEPLFITTSSDFRHQLTYMAFEYKERFISHNNIDNIGTFSIANANDYNSDIRKFVWWGGGGQCSYGQSFCNIFKD